MGDLAIDVAEFGASTAPTLMVSSGLHGVEGFVGSALQLALLEHLHGQRPPDPIRIVLVHAVNPFGFDRLRRFDEAGIDLNRNFLFGDQTYSGCPDAYHQLNGLLNPESSPGRYDLFTMKCMWLIFRYGIESLKQAVAGGQYEYPRGLFFGGQDLAMSSRLVQENAPSWVGAAQQTLHVDIHSGLGKFGRYQLLTHATSDSDENAWFCRCFGAENVQSLIQAGAAYDVSGAMTQWVQENCGEAGSWVRAMGLEIGTHHPIRVLAALRAENRAHHYGDPKDASYRRAKREIMECFCPRSERWRCQVIESGMKVFKQAMTVLSRESA